MSPDALSRRVLALRLTNHGAGSLLHLGPAFEFSVFSLHLRVVGFCLTFLRLVSFYPLPSYCYESCGYCGWLFRPSFGLLPGFWPSNSSLESYSFWCCCHQEIFLRIKLLVGCAELMSDLASLHGSFFCLPTLWLFYGGRLSCSCGLSTFTFYPSDPLGFYPPVVCFAFDNNHLFMRYFWESIGSLIIWSINFWFTLFISCGCSIL